jgi:hypothetical protein
VILPHEHADVVRLVMEALQCLHLGGDDTKRALWRLVDAAGILASGYQATIGAPGIPTGLGYTVERTVIDD